MAGAALSAVRRAFCLAACLAFCLGAALPAPAQAPSVPAAPATQAPPRAGVQVGLEGARLVDFIRFLGQFMGNAPVFREDQIPSAQVTVVAPEPMGEPEVRELLALALRPAGLETSLRGGVAYVLPAPPPGPPHGPPLPEGAQILAWRLPGATNQAQAAAVAGVLERLRTGRGQVLFSERARLVVLADVAERVARLRPVLQALSALPQGQAPDILPLARIPARQAARALDMQLAGRPGAPLLLPLDWSNSLLVAGTPEALAQARTLAAQADGAGPGAPVLKAYRPRHVRPEKVLAALEEFLAKAQAGQSGEHSAANAARLRLDEGGHAVLALAGPELLERLDRLVEDLDQPRLRVYIEALVAELPEASLAQLSLVGGQPAGPVAGPGSPAQVGSAVSYRGRVADAPQLGLDALASLLAASEGVRVLAVPRMAVLDGAEARVSGGSAPGQPGGQGTGPERFRLLLAPRLEPGQAGAAARVGLRVSLEDVLGATPALNAEASLAEDQVLLLGGQGSGDGAGWKLFSPPGRPGEPGRLVVLVNARVVRPAAPERGLAPAPPGDGKAARDKK